MSLFSQIEVWLVAYSRSVSLEAYSFFGGFIEEVIAPIPSPLVMASAGSAAFAQSKGYPDLLWFAFVGSLGKGAGAWLVYEAASRLEDLFLKKFGKFFGVSSKEIADLEKRLRGKGREGWIIFVLRMLPIVPSSPVSVVCGLMKIPIKTYLTATLLGNFIRNFIFLYLGYAGLAAYGALMHGLDRVESLIQILLGLALAVFLGWIYWKRKRGNSGRVS